ncbi:HTH_Tnp_Tc3_2 domain-containing protein [Trichonephila clavipes]|uniref:HTH_Tnp_Tc3_2 domain-containing protein n=1 Tax=Trichonephila clavipes TaxID=2585209 RepID=A0A8X6VRA4_TRICX|nr:HTH_Tnp_Tc3_2 domain-containing protein [Trichonephila clavipes]
MDDNARAHRDRIVDGFHEEDIPRMNWSSKSPELNPIEDVRQRTISECSPPARIPYQSALIWRAPGTSYNQENAIERHHYGDAGWLVWGEIIFGSRTDLHVQSETMTDRISIGMSFWNNMYVCFGAPWVLNFYLWMITPVLKVQTL